MRAHVTTLLIALLTGWNTFAQGNNMTLVSRIDYMALHGAGLNDCWGYVDETGIEYALVGTTKGTSIMSLADPANPVEVFWKPGVTSTWRDLQVWGDYAYITTEGEDGGLLIIDMSPLPASTNLQTVTYYGTFSTGIWTTSHDVFIDSEGYAYICGANRGNGGIIILDVHTDPMAPVEVGVFDNWYCHDAFAQGDLLYGAHISNGLLSIIDISDRSNPVLINTQTTPNAFTHNVWVTTNDQFAVTTDEVAGAYLTLYDVSDPGNIRETDRIQSSPGYDIIPHNAFILHDSLIVSSYYTDGITIHDMSRPHNLVQLASYDTHPLQTATFNGSWGAYPFLPSGLMLASDMSEGLFVLQPNLQPACYYEGLVRDVTDLSVLQDVTVTMQNDPQTDRSDALGKWAVGTAVAGTKNVTFNKVAYYPQTVSVNFANGVLIEDTIDLVPIPPFQVTVVVTDAVTGNPVVGANIRVKVPEMIIEDITNGFGERQLSLYYPGMSILTVGKWGYRTQCSAMQIDATTGTITVQLEPGIYDDFAFDFGWTHTADGAYSGLWERGIPIGTDNPLATPDIDADYDCDDYAYVTGNADNAYTDFDDVDGGRVTLYSPQFDLTTFSDPFVHYSRWFYCNYGPFLPLDDTLKIFLSNGTTTIKVDEALPDAGNYSEWISRSIRVTDFLPVSANMQLIVTVADYAPQVNITEAGLDRFFVSNQDEVGIAEHAAPSWIVFPNPASSQLTVSGLEVPATFTVTDLAGKHVLNGALQAGATTIDCALLVKGMYVLRIENRAVRFIKD